MVVDPVACDGAGVCAELLPERSTSTPGDSRSSSTEAIPTAVVDHAPERVTSCPRLALTLVSLGA